MHWPARAGGVNPEAKIWRTGSVELGGSHLRPRIQLSRRTAEIGRHPSSNRLLARRMAFLYSEGKVKIETSGWQIESH